MSSGTGKDAFMRVLGFSIMDSKLLDIKVQCSRCKVKFYKKEHDYIPRCPFCKAKFVFSIINNELDIHEIGG